MAGAGDQLTRLLALLPWLRARPGVTKAAAAAAFGISVAQLEKDLRLAFTCELPGQPDVFVDIDYLDSDRVTVLDPQSIDRPLRLRTDEAVALLVGLRSLAALPGLPGREAVDSALAKLEDAAGEVGLTAPRDADQPAEGTVAEVVGAALAGHRRVHLAYWVPSRDEVTQRDVDPMRLVTVDGVGYLEGWCHLSESVRTFRLDRVVAAQAPRRTRCAAVRRRTVGPARHLPALRGRPAGRPRARPRGALGARVPALRVGRGAARAGGCGSSCARPTRGYARRLVLGLGGAARVLEPAFLAAEVAAEAEIRAGRLRRVALTGGR